MTPPPLKAPIVLAHGLMGFVTAKIGVSTIPYFRKIPAHLARTGNRVFLTRVEPAAPIRRRAETLKKEIRRLVGDEPVHLLAHSLGGLDARRMITHLGMAGQVLSLTTIGTPHRGTVVADRIVEGLIEGAVEDWMVRRGIDHGAFRDLRRESCRVMNVETPDVPGVRYLSVAGRKERRKMLYGLRFGHDMISPVEGENDGLVSTASARWGESFEVWDCDHANLVGWTGPREWLFGYSVDVRPLYDGIIQRLATFGF